MTTVTVPKLTQTVVPCGDERISGLAVTGRGRVYCRQGSEVLFSDDEGRTFQPTPARPATQPFELLAVGDRLWSAGANNGLCVTDDGGLTWTSLPTDHEGNYYRVRCGPDGRIWACGDGTRLMRSDDGLHFKALELDPGFRRLLGLGFVGDTVVVSTGSGALARVGSDGAVSSFPLARQPISRVLAVGQVQLVIGDGGEAYRSTDGGGTFSRIDLPYAGDLEDLALSEAGLFVVGNDGALLFSTDQGATFVRIPTEIGAHLWTVLEIRPGVLLFGGDDGVLVRLEIDRTQTMQVEALPVANTVEEEEEEEGGEEEQEDEGSGAEEAESPEQIAEASARWKKEGREFIDSLNAYVRRCYEVGSNQAGDEPSETRSDLAGLVVRELVKANESGRQAEFRSLFPPAYEPFDYDGLGLELDAVAFLDERRRLVSAGGEVFLAEPERIARLPVQMFGRSSDRKLWAKVYEDRIDVHREWDGPAIGRLPRPEDCVNQVVLTPEGDAAAVAGDSVWWVTAAGARRLARDASYCHVALSPDGRFFAWGTQDTAHRLLDRATGEEHSYNPASEYPHFAFFHPTRPELVFSSCHALYGSASIVVDLAQVGRGLPGAKLLNRRAWVHSGDGWEDRLLLGDHSGYVWFTKPGEETPPPYLFLGSSLTALEVSADGKRLLVGSFAGYLVELELGAATPDASLLTNAPVKEAHRWVFWQGHDPMVW